MSDISDNMSENRINASCAKCGRHNPPTARFCGGCGSLQELQLSAEALVKDLKKNVQEIRGSRNLNSMLAPCNADNSSTNSSSLETDSLSAKKFRFRFLKCFPLAWRKRLAMSLFICLTFLVVTLLTGLTQQNQVKDPNWVDFRVFLSRSFELTNQELDQIYRETFGEMPDAAATINSRQAGRIERTLQNIFQQPQFTIFPNPFFKGVSEEFNTNLETISTFTDISSSHPAHTALKALLDLKIDLADKDGCFNPYEPISWKDWQQTVDQLFKLLGIESEASDNAASSRVGLMTNIDLRNAIEHLRARLYIRNSKPLLWTDETFYPGRLEAFSTLAAVIKELDSNG
ncbi:MAG: hypothetical protein CVV42_10020 [Candidatus Riflebacteria bacterium HGW-Riflebacteria-2]|jgi:ribosomal protein L40E|nr:MAG: hypothetical protein CVV42_10020 [Candidatus Riflebacteria bacterium HGW-Riflebacteria-2]